MLFRGGRRGKIEMQSSDDVICSDVWIGEPRGSLSANQRSSARRTLSRWATGAPFAFPGRAACKRRLGLIIPPIALAGDLPRLSQYEAAAQAGALGCPKKSAGVGWSGRNNHPFRIGAVAEPPSQVYRFYSKNRKFSWVIRGKLV